jgi:hypothetical protein
VRGCAGAVHACDGWPSGHQVGRPSTALSCQAAQTRHPSLLQSICSWKRPAGRRHGYLLATSNTRPLRSYYLHVGHSGPASECMVALLDTSLALSPSLSFSFAEEAS